MNEDGNGIYNSLTEKKKAMSYSETICKSFSQYLDITAEWSKRCGRVLYRGCENGNWPLMPGIGRHSPMYKQINTSLEEMEKAEYEKFCHECYPYYTKLQINRSSKIEMLSVMQHYRWLTRLLDWTDKKLIALHFALAKAKADEEFVVWAFCPQSKIILPDNFKDADPFSLTKIYCYQPIIIDERIKEQGSWFTIHPCIENAYFLSLEALHKDDLALIRFDPSCKADIQFHLNDCKINQSTIFPGMDKWVA